MKDNELKQYKKMAGNLALLGLVETILQPRCPGLFAEAYRIIFNTDSKELKTIAGLLGISTDALQKEAFTYLTERGFPVNVETKH